MWFWTEIILSFFLIHEWCCLRPAWRTGSMRTVHEEWSSCSSLWHYSDLHLKIYSDTLWDSLISPFGFGWHIVKSKTKTIQPLLDPGLFVSHSSHSPQWESTSNSRKRGFIKKEENCCCCFPVQRITSPSIHFYKHPASTKTAGKTRGRRRSLSAALHLHGSVSPKDNRGTPTSLPWESRGNCRECRFTRWRCLVCSCIRVCTWLYKSAYVTNTAPVW